MLTWPSQVQSVWYLLYVEITCQINSKKPSFNSIFDASAWRSTVFSHNVSLNCPSVSQRDLRRPPQVHQGLPRRGGELHAAAPADVGARPASGRQTRLDQSQRSLHVEEGRGGPGGRWGRTLRRFTPGHRWGGRRGGREEEELREEVRRKD